MIATLIYETAALASFGAFFSLRGAYSDSGMVLFGSEKSMLECFLLMILLTLFSSLAVSLTSLAVSAFCKKTFAAAGANLVMLLIPLVFGHFYYVTPNVNLAGVVSSLPINIPLADYGLSTYREIIINDAIVGSVQCFAPVYSRVRRPDCGVRSVDKIWLEAPQNRKINGLHAARRGVRILQKHKKGKAFKPSPLLYIFFTLCLLSRKQPLSYAQQPLR